MSVLSGWLKPERAWRGEGALIRAEACYRILDISLWLVGAMALGAFGSVCLQAPQIVRTNPLAATIGILGLLLIAAAIFRGWPLRLRFGLLVLSLFAIVLISACVIGISPNWAFLVAIFISLVTMFWGARAGLWAVVAITVTHIFVAWGWVTGRLPAFVPNANSVAMLSDFTEPFVWMRIMLVAAGLLAAHVIMLRLVLGELNQATLDGKKAEGRFRDIVHHSEIGMAYFGPANEVLDVNPAYCRMLGYSREELFRLDPFSIIHPDDREKTEGALRRVRAREIDSYRQTKRYRHKAGHYLWVELYVTALRDPAGNITNVFSQIQDITERKAAQMQLAGLSEQLNLAFQIANVGLWQFWPKTQQTGWDARMYEIFEADPGSAPPTAEEFARRVHPEDLAEFQGAWDTFWRDGGIMRQHFRMRMPGGGHKHIESRAVMRRDEAGQAEWILGVNLDLTEVVTASTNAERYREQLIQSQKMETLGQLAGGIAHDFNNMLTGINGFVQLAAQTLPPEHEGSAMLEQAKRASADARDLVRRILTYSRQAPARARQPLRLSAVIRESAQLLATLIPSQVTLHLDLADNEPSIQGDASQLQQVLMNLCANAVHALGQDRGRIRVAVDAVAAANGSPGGQVRLQVGDSGCGMPAETLSRIFEPFFTTKAAGEGTGLGLAIVRDIIQEHGASIVVESAVGAGTTFTMLFPVRDAAPAPAEAKRLLVIDDDSSIAALASAVLRQAGYAVTAHVSASEAWRTFAADADRFELILTDYMMPEMDGLEFVRRAQALSPGLPYIIMTGDPSHPGLRQVAQSRLVPKPFASAVLLQAVRAQRRDG
ncbi:MAG: PAS domain S-box protein [Opitutales bacterium]